MTLLLLLLLVLLWQDVLLLLTWLLVLLLLLLLHLLVIVVLRLLLVEVLLRKLLQLLLLLMLLLLMLLLLMLLLLMLLLLLLRCWLQLRHQRLKLLPADARARIRTRVQGKQRQRPLALRPSQRRHPLLPGGQRLLRPGVGLVLDEGQQRRRRPVAVELNEERRRELECLACLFLGPLPYPRQSRGQRGAQRGGGELTPQTGRRRGAGAEAEVGRQRVAAVAVVESRFECGGGGVVVVLGRGPEAG